MRGFDYTNGVSFMLNVVNEPSLVLTSFVHTMGSYTSCNRRAWGARMCLEHLKYELYAAPQGCQACVRAPGHVEPHGSNFMCILRQIYRALLSMVPLSLAGHVKLLVHDDPVPEDVKPNTQWSDFVCCHSPARLNKHIVVSKCGTKVENMAEIVLEVCFYAKKSTNAFLEFY